MMGVTTDNREIELTQSTMDAFRTRLRGPLLLPGETGYEESRTVWNAMIDRRPAVVARCLGTADVAACVQFAREHGLLLCIKGGGHNIAGLATADGALMLNGAALSTGDGASTEEAGSLKLVASAPTEALLFDLA